MGTRHLGGFLSLWSVLDESPKGTEGQLFSHKTCHLMLFEGRKFQTSVSEFRVRNENVRASVLYLDDIIQYLLILVIFYMCIFLK